MASQPPPRVEAYVLTDAGKQASHNEDYVGYFVPDDPQDLAANGQLFLVADGIGGKAAGEVASEHAVKKVLHDYYDSGEPDIDQRLVNAIRSANADLYEYVVGSNKPQMGTTLVATLIRGNELHVANVGDSRAYLVRGNAIRQITQDHSLVDQLVRDGAITPEEAREHPRRNLVLRSLGSQSKVSVDVFTGQLRSGDVVVMCSDGLTRYVSDDEISNLAAHMTGEDACRTLVRMANDRGGEDNISVALLFFDPLTSPAEEGIAPPGQSKAVALSAPPSEPALPRGGASSPAASLQDVAGKPKTLAPQEEPPSLRERVTALPWRDIGFGAAAVAAGVAVVLGVGYGLPSLGVQLGGTPEEEAELPATTVSTTATAGEPEAPTPTLDETLAAVGEATAIPVTITPSPAPTIDPNLTQPVEIFEGEFVYGATALQSEEALELCAELGGTCLADFFEDAEPAVNVQMATYYMDRSEVTNGAYSQCEAAGDCTAPEGIDTEGLGIADYYLNEANRAFPVTGVTWAQANTYCRWAGGRLPTEAEWEKAASWDETTGEKRVWPWGNNWDPSRVNFRNADDPASGPEPVGSRPENASAYGLLDMSGNVSEWVADWYDDDYYASLVEGAINPQGPGAPTEDRYKVVRGGSWETNGVFTRTIHRLLALEDHFNKSIGFRCAYDSNPQPGPGPGAGPGDAPPLIPGDETTPTLPAP